MRFALMGVSEGKGLVNCIFPARDELLRVFLAFIKSAGISAYPNYGIADNKGQVKR